MPKVTIELEVSDAAAIYRNLRNHFIAPEDQRVVYDFVHKLDNLLVAADQAVDNGKKANL